MADSMNPKALNELGDAFFYGLNKPINREMAYSYYKQAADMDNPVGYCNIGKYFAAEGEWKRAIEALNKARLFHYTPAMLLLAEMAMNGRGMHKNKKKAFKFMLEAAEFGDIDAFLLVGQCYENGTGVSKDENEAFRYYQKAADQANSEGMYRVGKYYLTHPKVKKAFESALVWLDKAAELGNQFALKELIRVYTEATDPSFRKKSPQFLREMVFMYTEALAKTGDITSQRIVAETYFNGTDLVKKQLSKAFEYYQLLAAKNDLEGEYGLGVCCLNGQGTTLDLAKAEQYLLLAASHNHLNALVKLGDLYAKVQEKPDFEKAKEMYTSAAKRDSTEALVKLGILHYRAQIAGASPVLALQFLTSAAKKGDNSAEYWLGVLYQNGEGVPKNYDEAEKHYRKAIQGGNLGAKYKVASMLIEEAALPKTKAKQADKLYSQAKSMLMEYALDPMHNHINALYAMYSLGELFENGRGTQQSARTARYWYESAAKDLSKAMLKMHLILKETPEKRVALDWLNKALVDPQNADAMYHMACLYLEGYADLVQKDLKQARLLLESASRLNHKEALAKLMTL